MRALVPVLVFAGLVACGSNWEPKPGRCLEDSDCTPSRGFPQELNRCSGETNDPTTRYRCVETSSTTDGGMLDTVTADTTPEPECGADKACADPAKGICIAGRCMPCETDAQCSQSSPDVPLCASGVCVACKTSIDCRSADAPICGAGGTCVACNAVGAPVDGCAKRAEGASPVCADTGECVECVRSQQCTADPTKPICQANACVKCSADSQCVNKLGADPGVCMDHQDGRCATDEETIYVSAPGCSANGGTSTRPLCSAQDAMRLFSPTKRLVVIRGAVDRFAWSLGGPQVTVVGEFEPVSQLNASVSGASGSAIRVSGGDLYIRNLTVKGSIMPGIVADNAAIFRSKNLTVINNDGGGIALLGAGFDIIQTTVIGNGPGRVGTSFFGGVLVQNPPSGAPARLEQVTIKDNKAQGLICSGAIEGKGVLAARNPVVDVDATCGFSSCTTGEANCGAPEE